MLRISPEDEVKQLVRQIKDSIAAIAAADEKRKAGPALKALQELGLVQYWVGC